MDNARINRTAAFRNSARELMRDFRETARNLGNPGMLMPSEAAAQAAHLVERSTRQWQSTEDRYGFLAVMRGEVVAEPVPQGDLEGLPAQFYTELARLIETASGARRG